MTAQVRRGLCIPPPSAGQIKMNRNTRTLYVAHVLFLVFTGQDAFAWSTPRQRPCNYVRKCAGVQGCYPLRRCKRALLLARGDGNGGSSHRMLSSDNSISKTRNALKSVIGFISSFLRRLLWPGLSKGLDSSIDAPLPELARLGCPFLGSNIVAGSQKKGPEYYYSEASRRLGHPGIWRFYFLGSSVISVSGASNVNAVLQSRRFNIAPFDSWQKESKKKRKRREVLISSNSVMFEADRDKHQLLRHLMGTAFTPQALKSGTQNIFQSANEHLERMMPGKITRMDDSCKQFTLDIAWRQIIGLDFNDDDEVQHFQKAVETYVSGLFSIAIYLNLPWKTLWSPPYRARRYLVTKIKERIAMLEENGPDGTILSSLVFSSEDDSDKRLSLEDVVENTLILLVAGTETTASTLTSAIFFLGLHPHVLKTLQREQQALIATDGSEISLARLETCTYLDAVIKETMRLVPVSGTNLRTNTEEGFVMDGKQVPQGANVFCNIRLTHELDPKAKFSMDPTKDFDPERWLDPSTRPDTDYMPFGTGSRRCLGAPLAMAEMRIFLALFARTVDRFELAGFGGKEHPSIRWKPFTLVPQPLDGAPIRANSVNQAA